MAAKDPRAQVEAPVRSALTGLIVGGVILFAVALIAGLCVRLCGVDHRWRMITHFGAAAVLLLFLIGTEIHRRLSRPIDPTLREEAWMRASQLDQGDAQLASLMVGAVPLGVLVALATMMWPHFHHRVHLAEEIGLWLPPLAVLWAGFTIRWRSWCRDHLARGITRSEQQLRIYWIAPGG